MADVRTKGEKPGAKDVDAATEKAASMNAMHAEINAARAKGCITIGFEHMKKGEFKEALDAFELSLKMNPDDDAAHFGKADALARLGRYDEALEVLNERKRLELDPKNARAWFLIADIVTRPDVMERLWDTIVAGQKKRGLAFDKIEVNERKYVRYDGALGAVDQGLKHDPKNARAWFLKADILEHLDTIREDMWRDVQDNTAIKAREEFEKHPPHKVTEEAIFKEMLQEKGFDKKYPTHYKETLEALEKGLELDPKNAAAWCGVAEMRMRMEGGILPKDLLSCIAKAAELDPEDPQTLNKIADLCHAAFTSYAKRVLPRREERDKTGSESKKS